MKNVVRRFATVASLALPACAHAFTVGADGVLELSLCIEENPYPPLIYTDRDGAVPILIKMAAREAGVRVSFQRAPFVRCLVHVRDGKADGYAVAPFLPQTVEVMVLPGVPGLPDPSRATASARMLVYRRTGEAVTWDGKGFHGLRQPVLHDSGSLMAARLLAQLGVQTQGTARNAEANLSKLLAGRGDAVVTFEVAAAPLLTRPPFAGRIEALPVPFYQGHYYLGVAPPVYARFQASVEALWQAISRVRQSPEYMAAIRDLPPS